jgi:CrcB protein
MTPTRQHNWRSAVNHRVFVFLVIFVGGGIGSMLRHSVNQISSAVFGDSLYGTAFVNLVGSFLMGVLAGWFGLRGAHSQELRLFLTTGIIGGFTTFSAFAMDSAILWERGEILSMAAFVSINVGGAIGGLLIGLTLLRSALS